MKEPFSRVTKAARLRKSSTARTEVLDIVEIIKEVDGLITVVISTGIARGECVDEIKIVEKIERAITIEVGGTDTFIGDAIAVQIAGTGNAKSYIVDPMFWLLAQAAEARRLVANREI